MSIDGVAVSVKFQSSQFFFDQVRNERQYQLFSLVPSLVCNIWLCVAAYVLAIAWSVIFQMKPAISFMWCLFFQENIWLIDSFNCVLVYIVDVLSWNGLVFQLNREFSQRVIEYLVECCVEMKRW